MNHNLRRHVNMARYKNSIGVACGMKPLTKPDVSIVLTRKKPLMPKQEMKSMQLFKQNLDKCIRSDLEF